MFNINFRLKISLIFALLFNLLLLSASSEKLASDNNFVIMPVNLSLSQAQKLALENNNLIKKSKQEMISSSYTKKAIFTNYLPKFELSANYLLRSESTKMTLEGGYLPTYNFNPETNQLDPNLFINPLTNQPVYGQDGNPIFNQYALFPDKDLEVLPKSGFTGGITLKQAIFTGGKVTTAYKMASLSQQASQLKFKLSQEEILYDTEEAYWRVVSLFEKWKLTQSYLKLVRNVLDKVQNSYDAGMINKNQLLQAKVKYNEVKLLEQEAGNGLDLAIMALAQVIGLPLSSKITPSDSLSITDYEIELDNFSEQDYLKRYDYQMLQIKQKVAKLKIKLERSEFLPHVGLLASYNYLSYELNNSNHDDFSVNAMAQFSLPLFQWGESIYKVKEAKTKFKEETFDLENNSQLMILQINQSLSQVNNKITNYELAQVALTQAKEYLNLELDNHYVGMTTLTDLLNAQTQWQKAYSAFIDAKLELNLAYKLLEKNCGKYRN